MKTAQLDELTQVLANPAPELRRRQFEPLYSARS